MPSSFGVLPNGSSDAALGTDGLLNEGRERLGVRYFHDLQLEAVGRRSPSVLSASLGRCERSLFWGDKPISIWH